MEQVLRINAPSVVAEIIDGEAVIMDLASGQYFSTQHVGCDIWRGIEQAWTRSDIVRSLVEQYGVAESQARPAVDAFVSDLIERNLVLELPGESHAHARVSQNGSGGRPPGSALNPPYAPPVLHVYTDMQDLLLLDPIHDVDETGWPVPKPNEPGP